MSNFFYLSFLTIISLIYSPIHANEKPFKSHSISVITKNNFLGETEFANRLVIAGKNIGWDVDVFDVTHVNKKSLSKYDWNLYLHPSKINPKLKNFLVIFDPVHHFFKTNGHMRTKFRNFSGYLTTYSNTTHLKVDLRNKQGQVSQKRWYPTVQHRPFTKVNPDQLFYFIGSWGNRYTQNRYQILQKKLAETNYAQLYGPSRLGSSLGPSFKGTIPFDGESVINTISDTGVCLILHSHTHLHHKIPSGRIFEAAAASVVIISDLNPFIIDNFGDSILYIDQTLSGEQIFNQIDAHMTWIQQNPEAALEMAKRSYQIFEDNFILENQLKDFNDFTKTL